MVEVKEKELIAVGAKMTMRERFESDSRHGPRIRRAETRDQLAKALWEARAEYRSLQAPFRGVSFVTIGRSG